MNMDEFWGKCRDVILIPRLNLKNPPFSRKIISILNDLLNHENSFPLVTLLDKILSRVIVKEIMVNWRPCCVLQLKHIVDSNNFPVCSKRLSTIEHSASHGAALCNLCARESGNQPVETLPLPFNLNQTQESVRISSLNALLDVTLQFIVSPDSNLIGIGEYVKEQFGELLHHKGNVALTPAELDCMLNSILHLYGSSVTGLQVSCVESDIDLMIEPPGTVRVPKSSTRAESEDSDAEESEEKESESESEEENEEEEEENGEDESNLDTAQKEKRIRINLIANREMREILSLLISKEEKARKNPKAQRSDQYLEFLTQGRALIEEAESLLKEQIKSLKLAAAKEAADAAVAKKATEQSLLEASNGTTEDHLPEVNLLKVVEKLIRRYGSQYGFTLTAYLHHIRVPLLSVRVALPRTLPSLQKQTESSDLSPVEAGAREGEGKLPPWISCDITLFKYHPLRNTAFICAYLNWDQSNKLKALMLLVKRFVQVNGIHGASHGFLSSYTWVMLVIHCLLRLEMIPPLHLLHHPTRDREKEREREGVHSETTEGAGAGAPGEERSALREENSSQFGFSLESNPAAPATAPAPLVTLSESSVTELFKFFLFYYTTQIDLISDVITLRGHGEIQNKKIWKGKSKLWRLSIEDPFERADTSYPHDLGEPLRLDQQTKMFQVMSTGYEKMRQIEVYCEQNDFATAGTVFYSLFEAKEAPSPPASAAKKLSKDKRKKKGAKVTPAGHPIVAPALVAAASGTASAAKKRSHKNPKKNKKGPQT